MTGQLSPLAQGKAAGAAAPYGSLLLKTGQTTQRNSELDDGYYEKGVAKSFTVNTSGSQSGTSNVDLTHLVSDTGAFTAADQTYTDAGKCGVFKAAGGETIVITGSASNNGTFTTASATANTVVVTTGFVNEADAPETTFKKREAVSNNTVLDNNTGLTWMRYQSTKMGTGGVGRMPWTGKAYDIFQWCAACNTASVGGLTDWRVPNIFELYSLVVSEAGNFDNTAFPTVTDGDMFTSTSYPANANSFAVGIMGGSYDHLITAYQAKTNEVSYGCAFLVRGG
jgi:hypothetical protein